MDTSSFTGQTPGLQLDGTFQHGRCPSVEAIFTLSLSFSLSLPVPLAVMFFFLVISLNVGQTKKKILTRNQKSEILILKILT